MPYDAVYVHNGTASITSCNNMEHHNMMDDINLTILGEATSKANSRKVVLIKGKIRVIKSQKALDYCKRFALQCPELMTHLNATSW